MRSVFGALCLLLCAALAGCARGAPVQMEDYAWELATLQSTQNGAILACSRGFQKQAPQAHLFELSCTVAQGRLAIAFHNGRESWGAHMRGRMLAG